MPAPGHYKNDIYASKNQLPLIWHRSAVDAPYEGSNGQLLSHVPACGAVPPLSQPRILTLPRLHGDGSE